MVRNVRWLYNKLGTEDFSAIGDSVTGALSSLQSELDGKSPSSHSHSTSSLPVSSNQVNSENYIPASAILYSMAQRVEGIQALIASAKRVLDDPNKRYESKSLGTWSSVSDVDTFLSQYNYNTNYEGLSLGNYVTIQDGTYNAIWKIAGFDMECGQLAADGTVYDNGYGICMIPKTRVTTGAWNTTAITTGGYMSSYVHTTILPTVVNNLKTVLGTHVVNRNVLLSSTVTSGDSSAYTWTTADATLMSIRQMNGNFASNQYDNGEANYKLPLFDHEEYKTGSIFWLRGVAYSNGAQIVHSDGSINNARTVDYTIGVRPLIYIR